MTVRRPIRAPRRFLDFPFHVDGAGRVAVTEVDDHVRDLIHLVLFTAPGERPNRPDFGCGLLELVHEPNSDLLAAAVEVRVRAALQRWLRDVVDVDWLRIEHEDARLVVDVGYRRLLDSGAATERFVVPREALA
jgi:phage baseplate assembly protein W